MEDLLSSSSMSANVVILLLFNLKCLMIGADLTTTWGMVVNLFEERSRMSTDVTSLKVSSVR